MKFYNHKKPLVTVILPVYNSESYIKRAINSLLNQSYKNIEILIINDGSIDNTIKKLGQYREVENIKIINFKENRGVSRARNIGILKSKGDYIAFLDSDDLYEPDKIERQINVFIEKKNIDFVSCNSYIIDENDNIIDTLTFKIGQKPLIDLAFRQIISTPANIIIKKSFLLDNFISFDENLRYAEDYDFVIQLFLKGKNKHIENKLYKWRRHDKNTSNNIADTRHFENMIVEKYLCNIPFEDDYLAYAKTLYKIGMYEESKRIFLNKCIDKTYIGISCFYLGNIAYYEGDFEKARDYYYKGLNTPEHEAELLNNLSCVYILEKNTKKAFEMLNNALKVKSNYIDAKENLRNLENKTPMLTDRELREVLINYE